MASKEKTSKHGVTRQIAVRHFPLFDSVAIVIWDVAEKTVSASLLPNKDNLVGIMCSSLLMGGMRLRSPVVLIRYFQLSATYSLIPNTKVCLLVLAIRSYGGCARAPVRSNDKCKTILPGS